MSDIAKAAVSASTASGVSGEPFVRVTGLSKSYGNFRALDDVNFTIDAGEGLALLGPSGCGKTTILRCIAGLETPDAGRIEIAGETVFDAAEGIDLPPEQRELGIVFQSYAIWPHMSVGENVGLPLRVRKVSKADIAKRVAESLTLVGLADWEARSAMALSGGQQQRVALARAIVHHPRLVLFDEPMSNLDTQLREEMRVDLKLMQQRIGFTSVYVTHDHAEAFALSQNILVMNRGRVEMRGEPHRVYYRPQTAFVAKFFGYNVVPGHIAAPDAVEIASNVRLKTGVGDLPVGTEVALCFRKEDVNLSDDGDGFHAEIKAQVFQGSLDELLIEVAGVSVRAIQPPRPYQSKTIRLKIPPDRCIVLRHQRSGE